MRVFKPKNRVIKLNKSKVELSNGISFIIVHNMDQSLFGAAMTNWLARTNKYTDQSFVDYVHSKREPDRIFVTLAEYEKITKGKVQHATESDYLAENN